MIMFYMIRLLNQTLWAINLFAVLHPKIPQEFLPVSSICIILLGHYKVLMNTRKSEVMQDYFSTSIYFLKKKKQNVEGKPQNNQWTQKLTIPFCTLKPSWYFKSGRFMRTVVTGGQLTMFSLTCVWFLSPCKIFQKSVFLKLILLHPYLWFPNCESVKQLIWEWTVRVNRNRLLT